MAVGGLLRGLVSSESWLESSSLGGWNALLRFRAFVISSTSSSSSEDDVSSPVRPLVAEMGDDTNRSVATLPPVVRTR